jgi:hypothetical protein
MQAPVNRDDAQIPSDKYQTSHLLIAQHNPAVVRFHLTSPHTCCRQLAVSRKVQDRTRLSRVKEIEEAVQSGIPACRKTQMLISRAPEDHVAATGAAHMMNA